jgi:WD40 repeat protein
VRIWSATTQQGPRTIPGTAVLWGSIGVSPDGKQIACLKYMGEVGPRKDDQLDLVLIDAVTARQIRVLHRFIVPGDDVKHASLVFSPDGRLLASALAKEVQVWDVATGKELAHFAGLCDIRRRGLAFSPDAGRLAFPNAENGIEVWDIRPGKLHQRLATFSGHKGPVTTIAFSPRGERVASGSTDATVQLWNPADGQKIRGLKGSSEARAGLVYSPDGRHLLASSPDNSVRIWDLEKGTELPPLRGHKSSVWSIAFSPSGTRLATAGLDRMVRLWTWPQREEILTLDSPSRFAPEIIGFTADGRQLFAAGDPGVTVWDATPRAAAVLGQK